MSTQLFPTFAGLKINVKRGKLRPTKVLKSAADTEQRVQLQSTSRWRYTVSLEFIREANNGNEVNTLFDFIEARSGAYDTFLFPDPVSGGNVSVRFEDDEWESEQFVDGYWKIDNIKLISVK